MATLTSPNLTTNNGRDLVPWGEDIWNRIDEAVHEECKRTTVASKFLPLHGPVPPKQLTVPSDTIRVEDSQVLSVPETATTELIELVVEFTLTKQQVEDEEKLGTAVTLATRAANLLSQAFDVVIFQGRLATDRRILVEGREQDNPNQHPLFRDGRVIVKSGTVGIGLLEAPSVPNQVVPVPKLAAPAGPQQRWGENTFGAVAEAYSRLQSGVDLAQAHYGPYALVLHYVPFADTLAPLPTTLIMPADRIKRLVTWDVPKNEAEVHFYDTGTLPEYTGVLVSLGGNTMDLVVSVDARTEVVTLDRQGNYDFRVFKRFALRLKDSSAVMRLEFEPEG